MPRWQPGGIIGPRQNGKRALPRNDVDAELLDRMRFLAASTDPQISGYVVVRHGYIVAEAYLDGFEAGSFHSVNSVSKSVTGALIGVALQRGLISSIEQPLLDFFPEYQPANLDERKKQITLRHLLSLTAGFKEGVAPPPEIFATDPLTALLDRPLSHAPGTVFYYDDGSVHLLSILLSKLTGMSAAEFARDELFAPMGVWRDSSCQFIWKGNPSIRHAVNPRIGWPENGLPWGVDRSGHTLGGFGLHLTLRDMAKFGYLYLNGGLWDGKQLVPAEYVREATTKQNDGGHPLPRPPGVVGGPFSPYGLLWWKSSVTPSMSYADGFGGQRITILPEKDALIAMTCSQKTPPWLLLDQVLLPAIH